MNKRVAAGLWFLVSAIVLAPISFITTILLVPFWRWLESTYGVEAIGHSGPSDWCYYSVYAAFLALALGVSLLLKRPSSTI